MVPRGTGLPGAERVRRGGGSAKPAGDGAGPPPHPGPARTGLPGAERVRRGGDSDKLDGYVAGRRHIPGLPPVLPVKGAPTGSAPGPKGRNSMSTILVTGGTGTLGRPVTEGLRAAGH